MPAEFLNAKGVATQIKNKSKLIVLSASLPLVKAKFYKDIAASEDTPDAISYLGTPVFDNIIMEAPNYYQFTDEELSSQNQELITLAGNTFLGSQQDPERRNGGFNAFRIDPVLIEVSMHKTVVRTPRNGAKGSIKEIICMDDYDIRISGFIDSQTLNKYPKTDVGIFNSYMTAPVPIRIHSKFLDVFGIQNMVVMECKFPQKEGMRNLQYFEINAISDDDLIIQLKP